MLSYQIYKVIHFLGLFMVVSAVFSQIFHAMSGGEKQHPAKRWLAIHSGLGLLLLLVGGFGMLARLGIGVQTWVALKVVIWLALGGVGAVAIRKKALSKAIWMVTMLLLVVAAWLAVYKPFV